MNELSENCFFLWEIHNHVSYLFVIAADEQITSYLFSLMFYNPPSDELCVRQTESSGKPPSYIYKNKKGVLM